MSGPRRCPRGIRAIGVMIGGPLILMFAIGACVRSALRSLIRGRLPYSARSLRTGALFLYAGPVGRWMRGRGAGGEAASTVAPVHAIEIDAPSEEVWPWLAQLGQDRGGSTATSGSKILPAAGCTTPTRSIRSAALGGGREGAPSSEWAPGEADLSPVARSPSRAGDRSRSRHSAGEEAGSSRRVEGHMIRSTGLPTSDSSSCRTSWIELRMLLGIKQRVEQPGAP